MKKKVVYIMSFICLILIIFFVVKRITKPKVFLDVVASKPVVETSKPEKGDIIKMTNIIGTVESVEEVSVFPKTSGEVLEVNVKIGDKVEKGDIICTIDIETSLKTMKTNLDSAELALNQARTNYDRQKALYDTGNLSEQQFESARDGVTSAELQYDTAKRNYDNLIDYSTVASPISGVIESCSISSHDMVSSQTAVCVIANDTEKDVVFNTTKAIRDYLKVGQKIFIEKGNEKYTAEVYEIGNKVGQTGMFTIKASISEDSNLLFATGETVKLSLESASSLDTMLVPLDSVYFDNGIAYIYTCDNGVLHKKAIDTGLSDEKQVEVLDGLSLNDDILVTWTSELGEGTEVDVK